MRAALPLCLLLAGCSVFQQQEPDPLLIAACPPLVPLADASFGATTLKLIEVAGQYHKCRCASLPDQCPKQ